MCPQQMFRARANICVGNNVSSVAKAFTVELDFVIKYGFVCHQTKVGVSRSHSVRDKWTVLDVYIVRVDGSILPEVTIERLSDCTQIV